MVHDSIETHFESKGSLEKPKLVGRLVRLAIGGVMLQMVYPVFTNFDRALETGLPLGSNLIGIGILFWVMPYVVNIGWSLNTKRFPQVAVVALSIFLGYLDFQAQGVVYGASLKVFTLIWVLYVATHLGVSFLLSAVLATPGCEMRSIPHLWSVVTGRQTKEHYCPGPLDRLDHWERGKNSSSETQK